jgi:hypothetical protein
MLLAATAALLIFGALLGGLVATGRGKHTVVARTDSTQRARVALERMTRELRQATAATVSPSTLMLTVPVRTPTTDASVELSVVYDCSAGRCTRDQGSPAAPAVLSGVPVPVLEGVTDPAVFTAHGGGAVRYVEIDLRARVAHAGDASAQTRPVGLGRDLHLRDGVTLRNLSR